METIGYGPSVASGKSTVTSIPTSETTLLTLIGNISNTAVALDGKMSWKSQFTLFISIALGSATKVALRYYASPDNGVTWYPIPIKNLGTGELSDVPSIIDSTTFASGGNSLAIESIPVPACNGFKVTGTATTATATLNVLELMGRDN